MHRLSLVLAFFLLGLTTQANNAPTSLQVIRYNGIAHVCPTGPKEAFTAFHVVTFDPRENEISLVPIFWSRGVLEPTQWSRTLDIARVAPSSGADFPNYFPISPVDPKVGDTVTIIGYDHNDALKVKVVEAKVLNIIAGNMLVFSKSPGEGSSGSCIFNSDDDVVGINHGLIYGSMGKQYGIGTILSSSLLEKLRKE
jgi:hypothetical protein